MMRKVVSNLGIFGLVLAVGSGTATPARAQAPSEPAATSEGDAVPSPVEAEAPPAVSAAAAGSADAAPSGTISVTSTPPGRLYVDGADTGLQTPVVDFALSAGAHEVKVIDPTTGAAKVATVQVDAGATLSLALELASAAPASAEAAAAPATEAPAAEAPANPTDAPTDAPTEAAVSQTAAGAGETAAPAAEPAVEAPKQDWTWTAVAGWGSLGVGAMSLLSSAVVLTTEGDPDRDVLGFSLFGTGAALVMAGGGLLYLDTEAADASAAPTALRGGARPALALR